MKPTLYVSPGSHHSRRVTMLVEELGVYSAAAEDRDLVELVNVDVRPPGMGGDNHKPEFLRVNPNGKVPVLVLGDFVLWESNAIMWFLCERHGTTPLWPSDPQARAEIAKWQLWQAAHLSPAADGLMYENLVRPMLGQETDPKHLGSLTESFHRWCRVLDDALARTGWLASGRLTCADIAVASALSYARPARMPIDEHPRVVAWLEAIQARPSWGSQGQVPPGPAKSYGKP